MVSNQLKFRTVLARQLRAKRDAMGLGQQEFAKKLAISQSTLARIESGQQNVTIDMLELICNRLKCKIFELLPDQ
ncbi:helix-turn-helix domain-containing protein [Microbulbifer halophilus]|uniref:Helix-turn-helix domain-containing protein n=1 Tax=Microbulbifer halophilus TaxID=453963 RepID=A0ABW5E9S6_9GAMM|nr:helix-turn-helix transcriptional regulator [Microbulbifer halophilus]MCW8128082.1 helix-turn-helix transcriptional regulator [Microbulbifer halophilus]